MFEFIRTHKKWMQVLLALIILPSFVLVGVSSYTNGGAGATEVASVEGHKITQQEWEEAQRQQIDRQRASMGPRFDQKEFETPEMKQAVLENLVSERALDVEIKNSHMTVGEAALQKQIGEIGAFKRADGSFDMEQYKAALAAQGMTPSMFDQRLRRDLVLQQLHSAVTLSAFAPRTVTDRLVAITDQKREVQEQLFPVADFLPQVQISDAMVKAYYEKNAARYQVPEQVKVDYVVFDPSVVESQTSVADAEVSEFYAKSTKSFGTPEQRTASHILVTVKSGASAADKAAAKAKADAILAEVRKAPASFAAVAKAQSQDPSSAAAGGSLGELEQARDKDALPGPVLAAVFKLKQGEISDVVESDFGYHVITLNAVKPPTTKTLDEVKPQIVAELKKQKMSKKYSEMAEVFNNTVEDQFESLKPVADKLQLKIQSAAGLARTPSPALGTAAVNNPKFLAAIFADETLKNKRNTRAVEVGGSTLIAGRVVEYKPAAKRPLAEVEPEIRQAVAKEEALKLARKAGEAKLAAAKASGDAAGFGEAKTITMQNQGTMIPPVAKEVLKADVSKLPAYVGVELPGMGYGVYRIGKVIQPDQPNPAHRAEVAAELDGVIGQVENYGYLEAIKIKAKSKLLIKPVVTADAK